MGDIDQAVAGYAAAMEDDGGPAAAELHRLNILNALASNLQRKRREAVDGRAALLIETAWCADEEFYVGYDEANRYEFANTVSKPLSGGGSTEEERRIPVKGSTVFPNITQPYVDAAAARVGDILLPTDARNWELEATPIPDMFEGLEQELAKAGFMSHAEQPQPAAAPMPPQGAMPAAAAMGVPNMPGAPQPVSPEQMPGQPMAQPPAQPEPQIQVDGMVMSLSQAKQRFEAMQKEAERKAEKAETQIDDWLTECQYNGEVRHIIDDCARIGSGVIKGPFPVKKTSMQWRRDEESGVFMMVKVEEIQPGSKRVDPWDFFPDPACGENLHNGSYTWERDRLAPKQLEDLIGQPGYIEEAIRQCLKEGPARAQEADIRNMLSTAFAAKDQFEVWYFYGNIKVEELIAAGCDCEGMAPEDSFGAIITMVNNHIIKAALNPLDDGQFPYDIIPWKRRPGIPWGLGVARQMRYPQRIVTAAARNLMDNAGLAAGPQIIVRYGMEPEDGVWEIVPLKIWIEEDKGAGAIPSGASPVSSVVIPMLVNELMTIIQWGMKLAEDVTGLPQLLQGQGTGAPDTVGGLTLLDNNATAVLRRFARLFDSQLTEPHMRRYYAWLMCYGKDDDAKGDFQIKARGSSALVERDIQSQEMVNIVQLTLNPNYGKSPERAMDEYLRSRRFDPAKFDFTDEEKAKREEAAKNAPPDPRIQAATIAAQSAEKIAGIREQGAQGKLQSQQQFDAQQNDADRQLELQLENMRAQIDQFEVANDREMSSEELKAMLAQSVMKLKSQERLSLLTTAKGTATQYTGTPPTEPAGRAPVGQGYQA